MVQHWRLSRTVPSPLIQIAISHSSAHNCGDGSIYNLAIQICTTLSKSVSSCVNFFLGCLFLYRCSLHHIDLKSSVALLSTHQSPPSHVGNKQIWNQCTQVHHTLTEAVAAMLKEPTRVLSIQQGASDEDSHKRKAPPLIRCGLVIGASPKLSSQGSISGHFEPCHSGTTESDLIGSEQQQDSLTRINALLLPSIHKKQRPVPSEHLSITCVLSPSPFPFIYILLSAIDNSASASNNTWPVLTGLIFSFAFPLPSRWLADKPIIARFSLKGCSRTIPGRDSSRFRADLGTGSFLHRTPPSFKTLVQVESVRIGKIVIKWWWFLFELRELCCELDFDENRHFDDLDLML